MHCCHSLNGIVSWARGLFECLSVYFVRVCVFSRAKQTDERARLARQLSSVTLPSLFPDRVVYDAFLRVCFFIFDVRTLMETFSQPWTSRPKSSHGRNRMLSY